MRFKKIVGKIHLWLGLSSGLLVSFLGVTGCMLAFEREIESLRPYQYVEKQDKAFLLPSQLKQIAIKKLPGRQLHSVLYGKRNEAARMIFYHYDPDYYYIVFVNPYNGEVLKTKDMSFDFFRIIINGHYYLWLPPNIGQPIVASATLIFFIMMLSGIILWWPRSKGAKKQRFTIRWNVRWRRRNYDLHNVLGFYMSWISIFIAITGLVMGFQWFAKSFYWVTSGGTEMKTYYEPLSDTVKEDNTAFIATDGVWEKMKKVYPHAETIEVHYPESKQSVIVAAANPDAATYWKTDYRYFDQYSLNEKKIDHAYGQLENAGIADRIARMNYDVHVGAIGGLPTKILVFFASLIAASLPITGFLIWRGRRKRKKIFSVAK